MASTADGRATIGGRAGPIGDRADSELLHGLRTIVDVLLVGAGTVRAEHYARVLRGDEDRHRRRERGLPEELLTCIVSASLNLDPVTVPLLAEPRSPTVIATGSAGDLPGVGAHVQYLRAGSAGPVVSASSAGPAVSASSAGPVDLGSVLTQLADAHGARTLLCEGGPNLASQLLAADLVDELHLCLAPKLAGGTDALRILAGATLDPVRELTLHAAHQHGSHLFLRYLVAR